MDLVQKVREYQMKKEQASWEGTFAAYLEKVGENPNIARRAHQRVYHMIEESGILQRADGKKNYRFFTNDIYGLETVFEQLVDEYFKPAAMGLDVRKRLLLLMGPVSGGKSSIVTLLKKGMEAYSHTDNGAVYAIQGCPMNQEPLLLLPDALRREFEQALGISIEGELNPYTRQMVQETYGDNILDVPVRRIFFSEKDRVGIGTFSPSDPKSQDIAELIGGIDFSNITQYGSESDPRAYRFDGELHIANRGLMEFQEILKCDEKFLWHLLSLTQEGNFKIGRFALVDADEVILAHTNESEYKTFIGNRKNEALLSRMKVIKVPYNLRVSEEERIYQKALAHSNIEVDIVPHALRSVALFSILTRIQESDKSHAISLIDKVKIYDGIPNPRINREELLQEQAKEGMSGIDPRFIINALSASIIKQDGLLDGIETLHLIEKQLNDLPGITKEEVEKYRTSLQIARQEHKKETEKVFVEMFEEQAEQLAKGLFDNYLSEIEKTGTEQPLNMELLREVEACMSVSVQEAPEFRDRLMYQVKKAREKGASFNLMNDETLKDVMKKLTYHQTKKYIAYSEENARKAVDYLVLRKDYKKELAERVVNQLMNVFR